MNLICYLFVIIILFQFVIYLLLSAKLSLHKMHDDLVQWIDFNVGDDIVKCKKQRPEYQLYVKRLESSELGRLNIPRNTVAAIRADLRSKSIILPIYLYIIKLKLMRKI